MHNGRQTSGKGNVSELKVLTAYSEAGFIVAIPFGGGAPYDLIVDLGHRVLKIQVKTGRLRNGCVTFSLRRHSGSGGKACRYRPGEFDHFAIYCPDVKQIYVLPFGANPANGFLRCVETKNHQRQNIRWADDYEFKKHIEILRKEMELVGLEPTASAMPLQRSPS